MIKNYISVKVEDMKPFYYVGWSEDAVACPYSVDNKSKAKSFRLKEAEQIVKKLADFYNSKRIKASFMIETIYI